MSRKLRSTRLGPFQTKKIIIITALPDVNGNDRIVSLDRLSIAVRADEMPATDTDFKPIPDRDKDVDGDGSVVDEIVGHDVVEGKTLCRVRRYGYSAKQDTVKPQEHLWKHYTTAYSNKRNPQTRRAQQ